MRRCDYRWLEVADRAAGYDTPLYIFWERPFTDAFERLSLAVGEARRKRVRHWYSFKTAPVPRMAAVARSLGCGIEVVSRFELAAARRLGFQADDILINGVAKHAWATTAERGVTVILDSTLEARLLAPIAQSRAWRLGLRIAVSNQFDPDDPPTPAQFGVDPGSIEEVVETVAQVNIPLSVLHFHLRSNVRSVNEYATAIRELADVAERNEIRPSVIDVGGGIPDEAVGVEGNKAQHIGADEVPEIISLCDAAFPNADQVWFENGRYLLGAAGVLVVTVLDVKEIRGIRFLICDGGRTNQALESDWGHHQVAVVRHEGRHEPTRETVICGPTCMAYDWIYKGAFSAAVRPGDRIVYLNAGAYHIPWETRFSYGLCRVLWTSDGHSFEEIRRAETEEDWLSAWR